MSALKNLSIRHTLLPVALACALVAGLPATAAAQSHGSHARSGHKIDAKKASKHFTLGAKHFYKKEYAQAIVEFLKAYEYKPDPMILYNLSLAHARLGNFADAYHAAVRASQMKGMPAKIVVKNNARIAAWGRAVEAQKVAKRVVEAKAQAQARAKEQAQAKAKEQAQAKVKTEHARRASTSALPADADSITPGSSTHDAHLNALGWTGVWVGVLGMGLAGYAGYVDMSMSDDLAAYKRAARDGDRSAYQSYKSDLDSRQTIGRIALYSGVACAAIGVTMLTVDLLGDDADTQVSVGATPAPRGASVHLSLSFK